MTRRPILTDRQYRIRREWQEARERMPDLRPGTAVLCRDAHGNWHPRTAVSRVEAGMDMAVVWVRGVSGDRVPWPADDVELDKAAGR